jgi:hypothetical protein
MRRPRITAQQRERFLEALAQKPDVAAAARYAGIHRVTAYRIRDRDPEFAKAWDEADRVGMSAAEDELYRRAVEGVEKPVFYQGKRCGTVREYSDTCLIFLLKSKRREVYGERQQFQHLGADGLATDPPKLVINLHIAGEEPVTIDHESPNMALLVQR